MALIFITATKKLNRLKYPNGVRTSWQLVFAMAKIGASPKPQSIYKTKIEILLSLISKIVLQYKNSTGRSADDCKLK